MKKGHPDNFLTNMANSQATCTMSKKDTIQYNSFLSFMFETKPATFVIKSGSDHNHIFIIAMSKRLWYMKFQIFLNSPPCTPNLVYNLISTLDNMIQLCEICRRILSYRSLNASYNEENYICDKRLLAPFPNISIHAQVKRSCFVYTWVTKSN